MVKRVLVISFVGIAVVLISTSLRRQDLVKEALASFPRGTIRIDCSSLSGLRTLPSYEALRHRYGGVRLKSWETLFSELGVHEDDIDEFVLGWSPSAKGAEVSGLASGRFKPRDIARSAVAHGHPRVAIGGKLVFCVTRAGEACLMPLGASRAAIGTRASLNGMTSVRQESVPSLASDERVSRLVAQARSQEPIWGVAVGQGVAEWFQSWTSREKGMQSDWSRTLQGVESLSYSVAATEKVRLDVRMNCITPEEATRIHQIFEGFKLAQRLAWQDRHPDLNNPFQALEISSNSSQTVISLTLESVEINKIESLPN